MKSDLTIRSARSGSRRTLLSALMLALLFLFLFGSCGGEKTPAPPVEPQNAEQGAPADAAPCAIFNSHILGLSKCCHLLPLNLS